MCTGSRDDSQQQQGYKYDLFICYRSKLLPDSSVGETLQTMFERFPVPVSLRRHLVAPGVFRSRLHVFRDVTDLGASSDLAQGIRERLQQSRWLVVVCTRLTPQSAYCSEEVRQFKELFGAERILTLLVQGEPNQSYPAALHPESTSESADHPHGVPRWKEPTADIRAANLPLIHHKLGGRGVPLGESAKFKLLAPILGCESAQELAVHHRRRRAWLVLRVLMLLSACAGVALLYDRHNTRRERTRSLARTMLDGIGGQGELPTKQEYVALSRLADCAADIRSSAVEEVLESDELAARIRQRLPHFLHAVIGLDPAARHRISRIIAKRGRTPSQKGALAFACAELGALLMVDDVSFLRVVADNYLSAIESTADPRELVILATALNRMGRNLPPEHAAQVARRILRMMEQMVARGHDPYPERAAIDPRIFDAVKSPDPLAGLGACLSPLRARMPLNERPEVPLRLAQMINSIQDLSTIDTLCQALCRLTNELDGNGASKIAKLIVRKMAAIEKKPSSTGFAFVSLGQVLVSLRAQVPLELVASAIGQITVMAEMEQSGGHSEALCKVLVSLNGRYTGPLAAARAFELTTILESTRSSIGTATLCEMLAQLSEGLPGDRAATLAVRLIAQIEPLFRRHKAWESQRVLRRLFDKLDPGDGAAIAARIVALALHADDPFELQTYVALLANLRELSHEQASAVGDSIVDKLDDSQNQQVLLASLGALSSKYASRDKPKVVHRLIRIAKQPRNAPIVAHCSDAIARFEGAYSKDDAAQIAKQTVAVMKETTDPPILASLGQTLVSLKDQLPIAECNSGARELLRLLAHKVGFYQHYAAEIGLLVSLVDSGRLPALEMVDATRTLTAELQDARVDERLRGVALEFAARVPREHAATVARQIVTDTRTGNAYGVGAVLAVLAKNVSPKDVGEIAVMIVDLVKITDNKFKLGHLGFALSALGESLPAAQAAEGAALLLKAMQADADLHDLARLALAIALLSQHSNGSEAEAALRHLLANPPIFISDDLQGAMQTLAAALPPERAAETSRFVIAQMAEIGASERSGVLRAVLAALAPRLNLTDAVACLKSLPCAGNARRQVLLALEPRWKCEFHDNVWNLVAWADGQGVEVTKVARFGP